MATRLTGFLRPVDRMPRIERKTVRSDVPMESEALRELFFAVAAGAKRLQRTENEGVPVAFVRFDVVGLGGWCLDAAFGATAAKRLDAKLMGTPVAPGLELIPLTPVPGRGAFFGHAYELDHRSLPLRSPWGAIFCAGQPERRDSTGQDRGALEPPVLVPTL